jgi:hypothetical protein
MAGGTIPGRFCIAGHFLSYWRFSLGVAFSNWRAAGETRAPAAAIRLPIA